MIKNIEIRLIIYMEKPLRELIQQDVDIKIQMQDRVKILLLKMLITFQ